MNNTGFNLKKIDTFKRYPGYEGFYIIESDIRDKYFNSVYAIYTDLMDALEAMDNIYSWDDCQLGYALNDGSVTFYIEL